MAHLTVSYLPFDKLSLSRVIPLEVFLIVLFFFPNNLSYIKSPSKGADGGRETADPSFRGISHLFRSDHTGH